MIEGCAQSSIIIKKDALYSLKNFTFCGECEMLEKFYMENKEAFAKIVVDCIDEMFPAIVQPALSILENMLYVFEKDKERTDPENGLNLVLEDCRELNMEVLRTKIHDKDEVIRTISERMWNRYFADEGFEDGEMAMD